MTRVAVLGTGRMGSAMARALARAGHDLVLYNRTRDRAAALAGELGATVADEPRDAVAAAEVALTMLADGPAVEETYRQPAGVLAGVHAGLVLLEMSTVEPQLSRALEPDVREAGGALLDSPVAGSVMLAESGRLTAIVGGETAALARARPVLDALAERVFHMGPVGSGAAMKLAINTVIFALNGALAEALVLAERAGVDREAAYDVLQASNVGAPLVAYKRAGFLEPQTAPTTFAFDLAEKDLLLITGLAAELGIRMPQAQTNLELIRAAAATEGGERDFALVAEHLRGRRDPATREEAPPG